MPTHPLSVILRTIVTTALLVPGAHAIAQFVGHDPEAVERRVDSLLGKMTIDEKIDLISGDTPFRTHPVERLGVPFFRWRMVR